MKAMILAAGRGERMQPLTLHTPKPLLKAGSKRLIEYTIMALVKAGFNEIIINTAHLGEQFPAILGDGSQYNASISYSPEPTGPLETAGGIVNALPLLGEEPFLIVNGDIWTDYDFSQLSQHAMNNTLCHLVLVNNPEHNLTGDFALSDNQLSDTDANKFTYSGIGLYHPKLFVGLTVQPRPLKPLLLKAITLQQATGEVYLGDWSDIGNVERLEQLSIKLTV